MGIVDKLGEFHRNNETLRNSNGRIPGARSRLLLFLLVPVLLLAGCADKPQTVPFPPKAAYLPPPVYRVQPGDMLSVKFLYTPELNEEQTVQVDGHVSFQYAPDLAVAGKTVPTLPRPNSGMFT